MNKGERNRAESGKKESGREVALVLLYTGVANVHSWDSRCKRELVGLYPNEYR